LEGPWRDYVGWAFNFEGTPGRAADTGHPDGPPCVLQGPADPIVGVHAGIALLAALRHRRRTGEGQLIEIAQIETAASLVAEPVIEYSMNGVVSQREGNRQRGYLQGVYPTAVDGEWVAISVSDDVGLDHDAFDEAVAAWTRTLQPSEVVDTLTAQGVPAERVLTADRMYDLPQLDARNYYQEVEHPITGVHRYPGWPFRITPGPVEHHRFPPPTLGQHNDDVLGGLGLTSDEIDDLRARKVIGERALNA
jgi:crotonobetainyl-CoA:carnitine CoA-transferase CaiB-like acyl-CoA transferase